MRTVALWEPDIVPPSHWLIPSILYQEKISTFAPMPIVHDRDGREARWMFEELGHLYEPLSLLEALKPPGEDDVVDLLRNRLPLWQLRMARFVERTGDSLVESWLRRTENWPHRHRRLGKSYDEAQTALKNATRRKLAVVERYKELEGDAVRSRSKLAEASRELAPELRAEKEARRAEYAETLERRSQLLKHKRRWGDDPRRDAAIRELDMQLQEIQRRIAARPPSHARRTYIRLESAVAAAEAALRAAKGEMIEASSLLKREADRVERASSWLAAPWQGDRTHFEWLGPDRLASRIPPLETIAAGKVQTAIFSFLATEAGMWVYQPKNAPYAGTLVGPRPVIEDVLSILAEWHCLNSPGWVTMSSAGRWETDIDSEPTDANELLTLAIRWALPVPQSASIAEARDFRRKHGEELRAVRLALASELPELVGLHDIADAIEIMRRGMAEPLADIDRALELEKKLGRRSTVNIVLHRLRTDARTLLGSMAAAGVATPVLGNTLTIDGLAAAAGGGLAISATGLSVKHVRTLITARRMRSRIERGPYRYLYELGKQFEMS